LAQIQPVSQDYLVGIIIFQEGTGLRIKELVVGFGHPRRTLQIQQKHILDYYIEPQVL